MAATSDSIGRLNGWAAWRAALLHALPVIALVLYLFYYWFAVGDRYIVFLYNHEMGPYVPDTSPFSRVTSSRYWMAGLVASGAIMVIYMAASWLLGRLVKRYWPPRWQRVWAVCAVSLAVGLPLVTMTVNDPTLPVLNAALVTLVTLIGLALALMPGELAAERPVGLALLASDGFGLALVLLNLVSLDLLSRWVANGAMRYVRMLVVTLTLGVVWLFVMSSLRIWRRTPIPSAAALFASALCVAYLLMPLVHHTLGTDGYYYISDSDNFFARSGLLQAATWVAAALLALAITRLRNHFETRRARTQAATANAADV